MSATRQRKLTDDEVRAIRADQRHYTIVAAAHGIEPSTAHLIRARKRKASVPDVVEAAADERRPSLSRMDHLRRVERQSARMAASASSRVARRLDRQQP